MLEILAHRGQWRLPAEKNCLSAMVAAWSNGFGIETDIRDFDGRLVISHNPPRHTDLLTLETVLEAYTQANVATPLALNVKADGLQELLVQVLASYGIDQDKYFLFDMAVPDALGYLQRGMPCFTRESEIEPVPAFLDQATGVWLDCFSSDWIDERVLGRHFLAGRAVALVSPELHGRPYLETWKAWRSALTSLAGEYPQARVLLCTDRPDLAKDFF